MPKKCIELSDLPPEILQLLVEKCDFVTRRRLRASSSLMYQVVNSTKLYIHSVDMSFCGYEIFVSLSVDPPFQHHYNLTFEKNETGGTRMRSDFRKEVLIENSDPMNAAIDWFVQMCHQKNVTIGKLYTDVSTHETKENNLRNGKKQLAEKLDKVLGKSEIPLKIKSIKFADWGLVDSGNVMWKITEYCDKRLLKEMEVLIEGPKALAPPWINVYSDFELFGKQDEIVKNLKKIQINDSFNVSVEDVLSLNASVIYLDSPNFTNDFVYKLIEKFTNRREDGSAFCIKNSSEEDDLDFKLIPIPPGFKETDSTRRFKKYSNQLIGTNHPTVYLRVSEDQVLLQIGDTKKGTFFSDNEFDFDTSGDDSSSGTDSDSDANDNAPE
ncbi:hypothetical protein GCK72_016177 [Caenorhabditis remanei]|uniref:F-box domain-containing protein n=1 Tax=Caenorhabditis remanei TaxID=31234 RepID=A0A6A5GW32_CAERE|nr:hypothetical protein GCK72_016177 [Caenorhabditis remanei]KAF1759710.1 hypothetical protein GCK72_016177 [Caenorhabditis remanei]